ncbi:MAG: hypothetical protein ABIZ70_10570 [Gemmatimonadales bacterium]
MSADDHRITLAEAIAYTHAWQKSNPDETRAWMLPRGIIDEILKQPLCAGIRVYAGLVRGSESLIWVGTDANGKDLVDGPIAEECYDCPPICDSTSPLLAPPR